MQWKNNKYAKWYFNIINAALARTLDEQIYIEKHHILPKSLGGTNDKDNIVKLTAREHFIAHLLLVRMSPNSNAREKMLHAAWFFKANIFNSGLSITSHSHEFLRKQRASALKGKKQSPEVITKRANALRGKKRTVEQKENMSQIQKEIALRLFSDIDYASNFSEKVKAGLSNMTSEAKDKMLQKQIIAANKRPPMSAEHIEKCAAYHRGRKRCSDTIIKMIASQNQNLINKTVTRKKQDRTWTIEGPDKKLFTVVNLKKFCIENNVPMSRMYKTLINNKSVNGFKAVSVSDTFYEKTVRIRK